MATFHTWIWKYKKYVNKNVWNMIGWALTDYKGDLTFGFGKEHRDSREFDLDEVLRPELFIKGFVDIAAIVEGVYDDPDEDVEDLKKIREILDDNEEGLIDNNEAYAAIRKRIRCERKLLEIAREFGDSSLRMKRMKVIAEFYKFKPEDKNQLISEFSQYYEVFWKTVLSLKGKDNNFIDKLTRFFMIPKKTGKPIGVIEIFSFSMDYLINRGNAGSSGLDFVELSNEHIQLQKNITEKVICQDIAVRKFIQGLFNGTLRDKKKLTAPESTFLFVGPPGVGKTYLAQTAAELIGRPYKIFSMSEYANENSFHGLIGFEPTWKDSKEGDLTSFVSQNENAVLIFDEIEKTHLNTIHLFLSILEGGFLRDLYTQQEVDFRHTIVIFTTNAGRKFYEDKKGISISSLSEVTLIDALRNDKNKEGKPKMPPEILSRMSKGNIIGFDHMNPAKLIPIIKRGMQKGSDIITETLGIKCEYDTSLLPYIFLYHMGGDIDARVASYRSESFIKDNVFHIAENIGENSDKFRKSFKGKSVRISFEVEGDEVSRKLTEPDTLPEILVVCNQTDLMKIKPKRGRNYKINHVYAESADRNYEHYITDTLRNSRISAILVDPFMRENKDKAPLSGLVNRDTMGNQVIDWLSGQNNVPPVYCMEFNADQRISFVDRQDLQKRGVKGILPLADAANQEERIKTVLDLIYEEFLNTKLERLHSRGRAVDFESGHRIEKNDEEVHIKVSLHDFRLIRSMDAEAQELFVDDEKLSNETFNSVVGGQSAKEELERFVKFIKDPELYKRTGQQISKGILMYGPPGTGKTKLARALACEADCPFVSATGTQFIRGEKSLTDVFRIARKYAPSIVFIDEIESFAMDARLGVDNYPAITKQLLTEMDGFDNGGKPVFVIAATNAAKAPNLGERNIFLDEALLRRFTKRVYMKFPSREDRIEFIKMKKAEQSVMEFNFNLINDKDIETFAEMTAGHSLSAIENVLNLVIGRAAERGVQPTLSDLTNCFEEFIYGEEKKYAKEDIRNTAIHEAGHAFLGFYCSEDDPDSRFIPEYATIIGRGGYLGHVRQKSNESYTGFSKEELLKLIRIKLAGRAAELVFADNKNSGLTTGASNDLETATLIAAEMLSRFGMEEGFLAALPMEMMMNSALAEKYYDRLNSILKKELNTTIRIIRENKEKIEQLADALLDQSRLDTGDMRDIINSEKSINKIDSNKKRSGR